MPQYGDKSYWDDRYDANGACDEPFDWMCGWDQLESTISPLIRNPKSQQTILVVGCGNAPFSSELHYKGGYTNAVHVDYSEVVIEQQRKRFPDIKWMVGDCLDLKEFNDGHFDYVIDKSLIDTTMCYTDGNETTQKLFNEIHRLLKPGGRLIQISLHKEEEVEPFKDSKGCDFIVTTGKLVNLKLFDPKRSRKEISQDALYHTFAVFDKLAGTTPEERARIISEHPMTLTNALSDEELAELEVIFEREKAKEPRTIKWKECNRPDDLFEVFDSVLEDISRKNHGKLIEDEYLDIPDSSEELHSDPALKEFIMVD
mmetsp:Transcript_17320/g.35694  ORF Transcript_17320/g.35694 Transcript_17320/m.35694 type:complete len:314 (-) Transcript_17320:1409-2350(-)|eukprot:CAMPEP_0118645122 /NCGR_PEP_ID=MMETSP0785-20121206/7325_1 /TAXON_ID=91992 /ORGANISM="Bolidomonas pacifica, Strain CCMP 1866" /LENGTH=313 /DNA_ID=CAMNT_0006536969 /DNA_START=46 /DNA_END=987 /DNA_ORIENTATION=+